MIQNIKYCRKCKEAFDIGINFNECPECRGERIDKERQEELE